jgi:membrane associated rhomboid family serine protease
MFPLYDTVRSRKFPLVNWLLIILNIIIFLYEAQLDSNSLRSLVETWAVIPAQLIASPSSEFVTVFSSMFLHGGWFHILSNMWILFIFGDNVEERLGSGRYIIFYVLSGIAAIALQAYLYPASTIPMIGASGAIAGVLGAYLILFPQARIASLVPILFIFTLIEIPAIILLGFWFVSQLFSGWLALQGADMSGVAWWAHVGGFIFGILAVKFFERRRYY